MRYAELTRKLRRLGVQHARTAKGSHELWVWPEKQRSTFIPHHRTREIAPGTLHAILKALGITEDDLRDA